MRVEIEYAISELAKAPFDIVEFPYVLLSAFGNMETTFQRLRAGTSKRSDIDGAALQRGLIHISTCDAGNKPASRSRVLLLLASQGCQR